MTFEESVPIVEGRLYAYGVALKEYPGPPSTLNQALEDLRLGAVIRSSRTGDSPQERWAIRHQDAIRDAAVIRRVMRRLPKLEQEYVLLRYWERYKGKQLERRLHMSERGLRYVKERVLMAFALEWQLLDRVG